MKNMFTKTMTGVLVSDRGRTELTLDEAEKIKREVGIPSKAESKIIDDKISTAQILSMLRAPLEQLVSEIERCFDYYREESGGGKIDSLVLFGGGASLGGLTKFLSGELGIEVKLGDALIGIDGEPNAVHERDRISHRLGAAVGAALSGGKGINLLPLEIKEETKRLIEKVSLKTISTAVVTILVLIFIGMRIQLASLDKKIATSKFELSVFQRQFGSAENQLLISRILQDQPYWEDALKEISNVVPQNIYLEEIKTQRQLLAIKGIILASGNPEEVLSRFIQPLERGIFKNVRFTTVQEKEGLKEFQLQMEME